jgi:hypothetical protein
MAHDVFLSYSSKDKAAADAVCNVLERNRIRVWMAPRDIVPGVGWAASIIGAINGARVMVLVFSSHANTSPQIEREVERAINKAIPVIPFRVENVAPSDALEYFISSPHWLDAFTPPFEQHLERLAEAVKRLLDSEFARATQQEERRKLEDERLRLQAEAARRIEEERRDLEEAEAARRAREEQRRQAEAEAARKAEEEWRKAEEEWRKAAEAEAARLADEERERREAAEATRQVEEERLRLEAEADRRRQMAVPDAASSLDETARPAQAFDSENLPGSGADRVKNPEDARLRSPPASHWRIVSAIGGLTFAASVAFFLMTKDSGHNSSAPPSGSERSAAQKGNTSPAVTPATPAPAPAQTTTSTVQRAPVTDCDRLAADAAAPDRIEGIKGVQSGQINIDFALPACLSATKAYPTELRLAYQLGRVLFAAYRFEEARKVLVDAAEMGNSAAKDLLGTMYLYGEGVAKDEAEAVRLYRQAADLGNAHAIRLDVCEERPGRCQGRCRSRAALSPGGGLRPCRRHE